MLIRGSRAGSPFGALGALLFLGCASTRSSDSAQRVPVITNPSGATATAGRQQITTPGAIVVPSGVTEMEIVVAMPGYRTAIVPLGPESFNTLDCVRDKTAHSRPGNASLKTTLDLSDLVRRAVSTVSQCSSRSRGLQPSIVFLKLEKLEPPPEPDGD
ncbi:MAG: hypothetical protein LC796_00345 [Acidobacteria bacterium]|nr:hypothetical protein [Acidobacteriota bacterium]MCA1609449.1 hypothetical protein [Acidobacteriota bacterium]